MKIIKQIIFLALWIGFSIDSSSQSLEPFFSEKYELYGYKDTHSGRLVLPLQYTVAGQFQDGFARVRKYGESNQYFIDQQGNRLATANYSVVNDFSDGMAMVKRNDSVGFINKTGKEIIPLYPDIFNVKDYHDGYSLSKIKWYYVFNNKSGKLTFPTFYSYKYYGYTNAHSFSEGLAAVKDEKGWGYIDVTGKLVIPDTIMTEYISDFKEGLALIYSGFNNSSCYLINRRGEKVGQTYARIGTFTKGLATVKARDDKWGVINNTGTELLKTEYDEPRILSDGMIIAGRDGKLGLFDHTGKALTPLIYDNFSRFRPLPAKGGSEYSTSPFNENLALVHLNEKTGLIHQNGNLVTEIKYDHIIVLTDSSFAVNIGGEKDNNTQVVNGGKWGYLDRKGNILTEVKYDLISVFIEGMALVSIAGKYGYIDQKGKESIPLTYDFGLYFSDGLASVNTGGAETTEGFAGGKWGFVDRSGKLVLPQKYDYSSNFKEGLALMYMDSALFFMDKSGKASIVLPYDNAGAFSEGRSIVTKNGKYGAIDKTGKEIIPLKYDNMGEFSEGLAGVALDKKCGFVDASGNEIIPLTYLMVGNFSEGFAWVESDLFYYVINKKGENVSFQVK